LWGVISGALELASRNDATEPEVPAVPSTTVVAENPAAVEEIARGFLDADDAYDADRAITYLTDEAIAEGWDSRQQFSLTLALYEAQGYLETVTDCRRQGDSAAGAIARCAFEIACHRVFRCGFCSPALPVLA
jgi:hypothetical protein